MRIRTALLVPILCQAFALSPFALAADYSSPREAYRTYVQALLDRDVKTAQNSVVGSDSINKFIVAQIQYNQSEAVFRKAITKAFPETAKEMKDQNQETLDALKDSTEQIDGDSATLKQNPPAPLPVKLKRVEGKWKVDLLSMFTEKQVDLDSVSRFRGALREVMEMLTPDVEQGKFKTYDDLKSALQMRMQVKLAAMDDEATTRPSK